MGLATECIFQTSRSGGPGGQNVNKVNTKVELRFHVEHSHVLSEEQKVLVLMKLKARITSDGFLLVVSQTERSQLLNKEACIERFYELIGLSLEQRKQRKVSKPTRASLLKRLDNKKRRAERKRMRQKPGF